MFKLKEIARAVALVGISGGLAQVALADDATSQPAAKTEKIEVIGSNIKRVSKETDSVVVTITRKEIVAQGVTTVAELIGNLAAATGNNTLSDISGNNSFASGASSAGLRNLGEQSTLVLLNGRRVAPNGLADFNLVFTNLDAFPIDAVERVDVLKSGASAIYGSDAVAGVINIITRKDYKGVEVRADHQQSITSGTFGTSSASITAGAGDLDKDRYNIMANFDAYHREDVMWTNLLGYINTDMTRVSKSFGTPSTYSPYGNFLDPDSGAVQAGANCPPGSLKGGLCRYNRYERFEAIPKSDRANAFVSGQYQLTNNTTAFAEVSYSKDKTYYHSPYTYYGVQNSQIQLADGSNFYYMGLNPQSPLNPFGAAGDNAEFRYRFNDGPNYHNVDSSQYRVLGGLRGSHGSYDWESAVGVMGSRSVDTQAGQFSASGFTKEIGCYLLSCSTSDPNLPGNGTISTDPNFFNQPGGYKLGGPNTAQVLNTLFPSYGSTGQYTQAFWDGKISGPLIDWYAGTIQFATGAELRHEKYTLTPTQNLQTGDIVGFGTSQASGSRSFGAMFGELEIPLAKDLEADVAARADKFPGFTAHISPKLGLRYEATNWLLLRGTAESGFRAPNLVESANARKISYAPGTADPNRCPYAQQLINDLTNQYNALPPNSSQAANLLLRIDSVYNNECNASLTTATLNNPNLKPETSHSFSLGAVIEPLKGFSVSADYWAIHRTNTINQLTGTQIVGLVANGLPLPAGTSLTRYPLNIQNGKVVNDPSFTDADFTTYGIPRTQSYGALQGATTQFANIYQQRTTGVDFDAKGHWNLAQAAKLDLVLNGTYLISYHDAQVADYGENLAGQYGFSRFSGDLTGTLTTGAFTNSLRLNYHSGYMLQEGKNDSNWTPSGCAKQGLTGGQCNVGINATTDYFLGYSGIKNLTVSLNIINVFNQKAPADQKAFGGTSGVIPPSSALQDAEGRWLKVGIDYKFF